MASRSCKPQQSTPTGRYQPVQWYTRSGELETKGLPCMSCICICTMHRACLSTNQRCLIANLVSLRRRVYCAQLPFPRKVEQAVADTIRHHKSRKVHDHCAAFQRLQGITSS